MGHDHVLFRSSHGEIFVIPCDTISTYGPVVMKCTNDELKLFNPAKVEYLGKSFSGELLKKGEYLDLEFERLTMLQSRQGVNQSASQYTNIDQYSGPAEPSILTQDGYPITNQTIAEAHDTRSSESFPSHLENQIQQNAYHLPYTQPCSTRESTIENSNANSHEIHDLDQSMHDSCNQAQSTTPTQSNEHIEVSARVGQAHLISSDQQNEVSACPDEEIEKKAEDMVKPYGFTDQAVRKGFVDVWCRLLAHEIKSDAERIDDILSSETVLIDNVHRISKQAVARGLVEKSTVEIYARYLIRCGWKREEYINKGLRGGGKSNKMPVDSKKLDAFITYALSSWNDYHKSRGIADRVVEKKEMARKRKDIRRSIGQFFLDETRRFGDIFSNQSTRE